MGLVGRFAVFPADNFSYDVIHKGLRGVTAFLATSFGVTFFGGPFLWIWKSMKRRMSSDTRKVHCERCCGKVSVTRNVVNNGKMKTLYSVDESVELDMSKMNNKVGMKSGLEPTSIHFRKRPDFHEIFLEHMRRSIGFQVGVFACGPVQMQELLADECRAHRFHYHPLNYTL